MRNVILLHILALSLVSCEIRGKYSKHETKHSSSNGLLIAVGALMVALLVVGAAYYYFYGLESAGINELGRIDGDVEATGSTADIRTPRLAGTEDLALKSQPPISSPDFKMRFKQYVEKARRSILSGEEKAEGGSGETSQFAAPSKTAISKPFVMNEEGNTEAAEAENKDLQGQEQGEKLKGLGKSFSDVVKSGGKGGKRRHHRKH